MRSRAAVLVSVLEQPPALPSREQAGKHRRSSAGGAGGELREAQRTRLQTAMLRVLPEHGVAGANVGRVTAAAGVSRKTFYDLYADRWECMAAALELACEDAAQSVGEACAGELAWALRIRVGLYALLELLEQQPGLARVFVIEASAAGSAVLARRGELLARLASELDQGRELARREPPPLTAEGLVGGILGVLHARLLAPQEGPLTELLNPLMSFITLPYLGGGASRRELHKPLPARRSPVPPSPLPAAENPFEGLNLRLTNRTVRVLGAIGMTPGLSNRELSERAGIVDQGQISKLLARLVRLELIENTGEGQAKGAANAWRLTARGLELQRATARAPLLGGI
jgi:AcrR family transcriptional regulator